MKTNLTTARSLVAGALLLLAGACGRTAAPAQQAAARPAVQALDGALDQLNQRGQFSGAALVADKGHLLYQQAYGFANVANREALRPDAQFDVTALGQTFTAAAVLALRDQGELRLDDQLSQYVPNLPYPGVTLRHLLTHTSGIPEVDVRESGNDVAAELYYLHPKASFGPGRGWEYTATNYALLQKVVEQVSRMGFGEYLEQSMFAPLGMRDTRVTVTGARDFGSFRTAVGYERPGYLSTVAAPAEATPGLHIYSTLADMHLWVQGLRSGQFLSAASVGQLFAPATLATGKFPATELNGQRASFGMGWFLSQSAAGHQVAWHSAGQDGYFAYLSIDLTADRVVILLNNTADAQGTLATAGVVQQVLSGQPAALPKRSVAREVGRLAAAEGIEAAVLHYASVHSDTARYYASEFEFEQLSRELQARQRPADALAVLSAYAATSPEGYAAIEPLRQLRSQLVAQRGAALLAGPRTIEI